MAPTQAYIALSRIFIDLVIHLGGHFGFGKSLISENAFFLVAGGEKLFDTVLMRGTVPLTGPFGEGFEHFAFGEPFRPITATDLLIRQPVLP